jgi:glycosyltransferase involved in cell wall biosynthesis
MKILHLISSAGMYGAETVVLNLTGAQKALGHEPVIGVFNNQHRPHLELASEAKKRFFQVEVFDCHGRFDRSTVRAIGKFVAGNSIDVVHSHGYKSDIYGYLAVRRERTPWVATCHLWTRGTRSIRFYEFLDAMVLRRARRVVGVSDAITEALAGSGIPESRLATVYNGTDLMRFNTGSRSLRDELEIGDRLLIGTVGRLETQKGIEYFVRAAQEVLAEFPDAQFVVIGEGSLRSQLSRLIHDLKLDRNVHLLGERTDMPGVYASLDLFVLASIDEGMPMTILEALAASRPVIATRVGAVSKLVMDGKTGLLLEARDVSALRNAILACLRDRNLARSFGVNGERHVRSSFSAEAMARNYDGIYAQAISQREGSAVPACQES